MSKYGKIKKPTTCNTEVSRLIKKKLFCLLNTNGIVERGVTMKFSISHGAIISDSLPEISHWSPNTKVNSYEPKK